MKSKDINLLAALLPLVFLLHVTSSELITTFFKLTSGAFDSNVLVPLIGTTGILLVSSYIQLRTLCICCFSYLFDVRNRSAKKQKIDSLHNHPVSVLVPAYNESKNIKLTLESIVQSNYQNFEIIVINDGSTDATSAEVKEFISNHGTCHISLIEKKNTGKWDAINCGLSHAQHEHILLMDADSRLRTDSIQKGINSLINHKVDVICGHISVINTRSLICKLQALEYTLTNCLKRRAQAYFQNVLIVPGPFGLYKRTVLSDITESIQSQRCGNVTGPVSPDTFAEDCDLTINALCLGFKIHYESEARVLTKAPENLVSLANQRYRWNRGHMQVSKKYISAIKNATIPMPFAPLLWLTNTLILDSMLLPSLFFAANIIGIYLFLTGSVGQFLPQMVLAMIGIEINLVIYATQCEHEPPANIPYSIFLPFYRIILICSWMTAALDESKSQKMSW